MPCKLWDTNAIHTIMVACVILHNMIVEDKQDNMHLNNDYLMKATLMHPFVVLDGADEANSPEQLRKHLLQCCRSNFALPATV